MYVILPQIPCCIKLAQIQNVKYTIKLPNKTKDIHRITPDRIVKCFGFHAFDILYLKHAAERGVGESDYTRIRVVGTPLDRIIRAWKKGFIVP